MSTEGKKNNNNYLIYAVIGVIVLLLVGFLIMKGCSKTSDKKNEEEQPKNVEKIGASEQAIIDAYGMSKNDAIEIVKEIYNTDNFEFSADINEDSKYVVYVKNTISNSTDKYIVDPTSSEKSFYLDTE